MPAIIDRGTARAARPGRSGALALRLAITAALIASVASGCVETGDAEQVTAADAPRGAASAPPSPAAPHHSPKDPGDVQWGPAPGVFPPGAEFAVMQGNPAEAGAIFTVRLRLPNDYVIPPHFHPADEHVTVVQGTLVVGMGNVADEAKAAARLRRGGFITAPKDARHWSKAKGLTVVQVHGVGPFQITYVDETGQPLPQ
ncbi:MAG: cupin protein [Geminicoccaceae bacterium]|jgi:quercetin dioxygenase-like cupin family protein|nr:cupin protein [Geminicoccaceae bacterium]